MHNPPDSSKAARRTICLNGLWDFSPQANPEPVQVLPQELEWESEKVIVPSSWRWRLDHAESEQLFDLFAYPSKWNEFQAGFLRRWFVVQKEPDRRYWLVFRGVLQSWMVFLNGRPVDGQTEQTIYESFLPVEFDVSDLLEDGDNELIVWCGPWEKVSTPTGAKLINPEGSWFGGIGRGIWQDVALESRPTVWIQDVSVQTSVRQGQVQVDVCLYNNRSSVFIGRLMVTAQVERCEECLKYLPSAEVCLYPGESELIQLSAAWPDAIRWSPEKPFLYRLDAHLEESGVEVGIADQVSMRFGFREIWLEGSQLLLNGVPLHLRGDAWHYQGCLYQTPEYARNWYRVCKQAGVNCIRLHAMPYPSFFLDIADEEGMLIVDESAIYGSSKAFQADHPTFIARCREHLQALVRRDRNHPSLILWSVQNEMRWVDGREGYCQAIPSLIAAIRQLDQIRPVIFDGDMRLVPKEWCDLYSLHYNIDGTIEAWDRSKPLLFSEHGPYHYISPQVCSDLGGSQAYLSFAGCLEAIGQGEALFIQLARREGVTGVTPFNLVNYSHWALPTTPQTLSWENLEMPGVHPRLLPAYALPIDNGWAPCMMARPNPALSPVARAFKSVVIHPDELNTCFYAGKVRRSFSLYNDREIGAQACLRWWLSDGESGEYHFFHLPGEKVLWTHDFAFAPGDVRLTLQLYHDKSLQDELPLDFRVLKREIQTDPLPGGNKRCAYLGDEAGYTRLARLLPGLAWITETQLEGSLQVDFVIMGDHYRGKAQQIQPALAHFVDQGGSLLVLEQDAFTLGELQLSGRGFFTAHPVSPDHSVFAGLGSQDLRFWSPDNPYQAGWHGLVANAMIKPEQGNVEILLECGQGNFGWGGLLWTPLLAIRQGQGQVIFCQLEFRAFYDTAPQACLMLRNLLEYGLRWVPQQRQGVRATGERARQLCQDLGLSLDDSDWRSPILWIIDPDEIAPAVEEVHAFLRKAGKVLVLPANEKNAARLSELAGVSVQIETAPIYQLQATDHSLVAGISAFDLFHLEKVTYTPSSYSNRVLAYCALRVPSAISLMDSVHAPWQDFFVKGLDGEAVKMAVATAWHDRVAEVRSYACLIPYENGQVVLCQVELDLANAKISRVYSRLLANLGADLQIPLLDRQKSAVDFGFEALMGLPLAAHKDENALMAYFTSGDYTLNHLGEGVYGWMQLCEKQDGWISLPGSSNQTWFLTLFIESAINRDPARCESGQLPDSTIVPDFYLESNCPFQVYLNGRLLESCETTAEGAIRMDDFVLQRGINRLALICHGGEKAPIRLRAWLLDKHGEPVYGLHFRLTLD